MSNKCESCKINFYACSVAFTITIATAPSQSIFVAYRNSASDYMYNKKASRQINTCEL